MIAILKARSCVRPGNRLGTRKHFGFQKSDIFASHALCRYATKLGKEELTYEFGGQGRTLLVPILQDQKEVLEHAISRHLFRVL